MIRGTQRSVAKKKKEVASWHDKNEEEYKIKRFLAHINNNLFKSFMLITDISEKLKFLN